MGLQVELADNRSRQVAGTGLDIVVFASQGEHAAVMVAVAVHVEEPLAGTSSQAGQDGLVTALAHINYAFEDTTSAQLGSR